MKKLNDDVAGITDAEGNRIASYSYDEWGKLLSIETAEENNEEQLEIATLNPLRYRGYYYDNETGMYYLQSRYYNPDLCRFISADSFNYINNSQVLNLNAYAYCINNPIIYSDPSGNSPISDRFVNVLIKIGNRFDCLVDKTKQNFEKFKLKIQGIKDNLKALMEKAKVDILNHNFSEALKTLSIKNIFNCIFDNKKSIVSTMPNMPRLYKNNNEEPNHQAKDLVDIILTLMIFDQISKDMIDLFGENFTNNFFGFLGNVFLLIPSSARLFIDIIKSIPTYVWDEVIDGTKDELSIQNIVLALTTAFFNCILETAEEASFWEIFAVWGMGMFPAELAMMISGIILDKDLSASQKFTLIIIDAISIILSNAIPMAIPYLKLPDSVGTVLTIFASLFPILTDLITKIIMKKDK